MGCYAPAQIVRDAREHGVEARAPDVNFSDWDCNHERREGDVLRGAGLNGVHAPALALRLGLRQIDGLHKAWVEQIMAARRDGLFGSMDDLRRRAVLPARALDLQSAAVALGTSKLHRREALW